MDQKTIIDVVNSAISNGEILKIIYKTINGQESEREILPIEWESPTKIRAFCHLRKEERNFLLSGILSINKIENSLDEEFGFEDVSASDNQSTRVDVINGEILPVVVPRTKIIRDKTTQFEKLKSNGEWSRLLRYYHACLKYEYQQKFSFEPNKLLQLDFEDEEILVFMSRRSSIQLDISSTGRDFRQEKFFDEKRHKREQLCLGNGFVKIRGKLCPLLLCEIKKEKIGQKIMMRAEDVEISYAAFLNLGFKDEEIEQLLHDYYESLTGESTLENSRKFLIDYLQSNMTRKMEEIDNKKMGLSGLPDYSIWKGSGLFWTNSQFTAGLMLELDELQKNGYFEKSPMALTQLLNSQDFIPYPEAPDFLEDDVLYITDINDAQRKAARAVQKRPITVITGPPGTGKSQLVLNIIAQAIYEGQSVLFSSQNNKAVDVVMDRLRGEINFPGSIRTGNLENRKIAVEQMRTALRTIKPVNLEPFRENVSQSKKHLIEKREQLELIRENKGLEASINIELKDLEKYVPKELIDEILKREINLDAVLRDNFLNRINPYQVSILDIKDEINLLQKEIESIRDATENNAIAQILNSQTKIQELLFVKGFFQQKLNSPSDLMISIDHWLEILNIIEKKGLCDQSFSKVFSLEEKIREKEYEIKGLSKFKGFSLGKFNDEKILKELATRWHEIEEFFIRIRDHRSSFLERIFIFFGIKRPIKVFRNLIKYQSEFGLNEPAVKDGTKLEALLSYCQWFLGIYESQLIKNELEKEFKQSETFQEDFRNTLKESGLEIEEELAKINLYDIETSYQYKAFKRLRGKVSSFQSRFHKILGQFFGDIEQIKQSNNFFRIVDSIINEQGFPLITKEVESIESFGSAADFWRGILFLWENAAIKQDVDKKLSLLPDEESALDEFLQSNKELFLISGQLLEATWRNRSAHLASDVIRKTEEYVDALDQLCRITYSESPGLYRELMAKTKTLFPFAQKVFPIWAITSLTARSNLPLETSLFDFLIIDEASQCNIPAALPLAYRAKQIIVIGDPNQLRHVASVSINLDASTSQKFGIPEKFFYSHISLFDLAYKSLSHTQKPILLNQHYRSDKRIIDFSNNEFYEGDLKITSDLTTRGFSKEFLRKYGGITWIQVTGESKRNERNGSSYNLAEIEVLKKYLPEIMKRLSHESDTNLSFGLVTPFRQQENLLQETIKQLQLNRVTSGTAHQFQGDECDFMFFLPVLANGIEKRTLDWLESTYHLLNVAITRARVGLFIIGDGEFCSGLDADNKYRRLFYYVKDNLNSFFEKIDQTAIFQGDPFEIIGELIDPLDSTHNRITLKRFLQTISGYLWWSDPYFTSEVIDLTRDLFLGKLKRPAVGDIRLITSKEQFYDDKGIRKLDTEILKKLEKHLDQENIKFEVRTLKFSDLPHDRFLYTDKKAINMPPFAHCYGKHNRISEYTKSKTDNDFFISLWEKAERI
jgi:hypothetical protein